MSLTPSQADVLRALARTPDLTPDGVAGATALPLGGVSFNLDRLEGSGFVAHELVRVDGELYRRYRPTPRGLDALRAFDGA